MESGSQTARPPARGRDSTGSRPGAGTLLFAAAALISAVALLRWHSDFTFWRDEWAFILDRRYGGIDVFLDPFVEQLLAIPVAIYKLGISLFGIDSPLPFQVASISAFIASVVVLFVYLRRRVGEWLALAGVLPILFFGPSWDDLLFPFQVSFFGSLTCGIGALLLLEAERRRTDVAACALLAVGLFFSHVGIPFVVAATVDIALTRERFRRAFVVAIPTALWLVWYFGWGHEAQNFVSFHNFQTLIGYVGDGLSSSLSSLLGLAVPRDEMSVSPLDWGRPLLAVALGFAVWRIARVGVRGLSRRLWAVVAAQLVFWSLTGLNAAFFGQATSGRYQLMGAVLWVMIAAELLRGVRVGRAATAAVLGVAALAALANFSQLRDSAAGLANIGDQQRGGLAALELTRGQVAGDFVLTEENSGVDYLGLVDAESYFSAIDEFGSPALDPGELATAPEAARVAADKVFAAALELTPERTDRSRLRNCETVEVGPPVIVPIGARGFGLVGIEGHLEPALRRYATESFPVGLDRLGRDDVLRMEIPIDRSPQPWQLELTGTGAAEVCELVG